LIRCRSRRAAFPCSTTCAVHLNGSDLTCDNGDDFAASTPDDDRLLRNRAIRRCRLSSSIRRIRALVSAGRVQRRPLSRLHHQAQPPLRQRRK